MILPTAKLLWIGLITPLLLLMTLAGLLIKAPLTILRIRVSAAGAMKAAGA